MKDDTFVQHPPKVRLEPGNAPVTSPIYQGVKFTYTAPAGANADPSTLYYYSRHANPTVRELELMLAKLQGREDAFAVGSGVAAISSCFFSLLSSGDHVVMFLESYKPTRVLLSSILSRFGVQTTFVSINKMSSLESAIRPGKTKLICLESPTNPMVRVPPFDRILKLARQHSCITLLDNTFGGFHNHGQFAFDIFVHSLTKFASGHGDAMGGVIIADRPLLHTIAKDTREIGPTLDPHTAFLISRGMKTYPLRFRKHCENAMAVAEFLSTHASVERVNYPGLKTSPDYPHAREQMKDFGAVVALDVKKPIEIGSVLNRLKLFATTGSLGSTESLAAPVKDYYGGDLSPTQLAEAGIGDRSIRLAVGLEDVEDLKEDLDRALRT